MNVTKNKTKEIRYRRARELDELRSKGVARDRKSKLKEFVSGLTTPEQAQYFLQAMRDKSKKEGWEHKPPSNLTSDGVDTWHMMQRHREQEMRRRRQEAEQHLRGYRAPYQTDDAGADFGLWSPRGQRRGRASFGDFDQRRGRASFGDVLSESLVDPSIVHEKRRQSTMPRLQHNWAEEITADENREKLERNPLGPERTEFLNERQHYDGTKYVKPDDLSAYSNGRALIRDDAERIEFLNERQQYDGTKYGKPDDWSAYSDGRGIFRDDAERTDFLNERQHYDGTQYGRPDDLSAYNNGRALFRDDDSQAMFNEQREPGSSFNPSRYMIDTSGSQDRLREAEELRSVDGRPPPFSLDGEREGVEREDIERRTRFSLDDVREGGDVMQGQTPTVCEDNASDVPETIWRDFINPEPGTKFTAEAGRYHLYASYACPGSHRALIVLALKGLEDVISVTIVHPTWRHTNIDNPDDKHRGWIFGDPNGEAFHNTTGRGGPFPPAYPGNDPDPIFNAYSVRELYEYACDTSGKYTIPLLWDKKLNTIVNNESSDISYMLNSCFNEFANDTALDLYTEDDEEGLDKLNEVSQWLYPMMIHGVYRCGFAKTQKAYDHAIEELTSAFDMADELLQKQRYLTGDILTDADIRLFVTLLRFDEVYAFYFRANTRLVMLTPALLNFCREVYQMKGVAETCQMEQIKAHFFGSHAEWNKYSVIPRGLGFMRLLDAPHERDQFEKR